MTQDEQRIRALEAFDYEINQETNSITTGKYTIISAENVRTIRAALSSPVAQDERVTVDILMQQFLSGDLRTALEQISRRYPNGIIVEKKEMSLPPSDKGGADGGVL